MLTPNGFILAAAISQAERLKVAVDWLFQPAHLFVLAAGGLGLMLVAYRRWMRAAVAAALMLAMGGFYLASLADANFRAAVSRADNIPITLLVFGVSFFLCVAFRRAAMNDIRRQNGLELLEEARAQRILVWPDLVYIELICMVLATAGLIVWSILVKAPLEPPANPAYAPNPAKAPWYFLGLQELLVYFDPWMAGVVYPMLIIFGLLAIPLIDTNPKGNGYYTRAERPFAIGTFLFGFLVLWVLLIFIGTFLRGPNWSLVGLYQTGEPQSESILSNVDLSQIWWNGVMHRARPTAQVNPIGWLPYWLAREWLGFLLVLVYLLLVPAILRATSFRHVYARMGFLRYSVMTFLLLMMALLPIKMILRWLFGVKYFIYLPEFDASL